MTYIFKNIKYEHINKQNDHIFEKILCQYQNSRNFPFLKYFKTSHKRNLRSVHSSRSAGFSRTAFCRTSNGNLFYNRKKS